jgi:hypothetical protein
MSFSLNWLTPFLPEPVVCLIENISTTFRKQTPSNKQSDMDLEDAETPSKRSGEVAATNEEVNRSSKGMQGATKRSQSGGAVQLNDGGGGSVGQTMIGGFLVGVYVLLHY